MAEYVGRDTLAAVALREKQCTGKTPECGKGRKDHYVNLSFGYLVPSGPRGVYTLYTLL